MDDVLLVFDRFWAFLRRKYLNRAFITTQVKGLVYAIGFFTVVFVILEIANRIVYYPFPSNIELVLALEILRALIQVDAALIGFLGIIAVYVFSTIQNQFEKSLSMPVSDEWDNRRSNAAWLSALTVSSLVGSLITTLVSISNLTNSMAYSELYWPVALMLEGIAGVFGLIFYATKRPPKPKFL